MDFEAFDSALTPLKPGVNLIEASAGTGKTFAIAMLALRYIVEQDLRIEQLLIVTFTKAATEELKDRIRNRLNEAKRALQGHEAGLDETLLQWKRGLAIDHELAIRRLQLAMLDIDQSGIFTIHGFCQRVLSEHALESGQLFDSELCTDTDALNRQISDDFWREQVFTLSARQAAILTARYPDPDKLLASVAGINPEDIIYPALDNIAERLHSVEQAFVPALTHLDENLAVVKKAAADGYFKSSFVQNLDYFHSQLEQWLKGDMPVLPGKEALQLYAHESLYQALNGNKLRKAGTQSGEERKMEYLQTLALATDPFDQLLEAIDAVALSFRRTLVDRLHRESGQRMQQLNLLSYDELISRLYHALRGNQAGLLKKELRQRFQVALIDEFQDTDNKQWFIFSQLFAANSQTIFLIGDPKQAIYKFRGADIFSYFSAQDQARQRFTLAKNWRSHPLLVKACNTLFMHSPVEQPFLYPQLPFHPVQAGLSEADGRLMKIRQELAPMVLGQLEQSEEKNGYWKSGATEARLMLEVVNEIVALLDPGQRHAIHSADHPDGIPLQPRDIAILVRSNSQARTYQQALYEVNVPSVLNSSESVFASPEAHQLFILLEAIAHPGNLPMLKQALTLSWFNLDGQALFQLNNDELAIDAWMNRFQSYFLEWQNRGLMAMILQLIETENVQQTMATAANPERQLTNLLHLAELLQQAAVNEHLGINKTLGWLLAALNRPDLSDENQLRLESDAQAVKIITMHRSKGLEFPVVFCPCLWQDNKQLEREQELIKCHDFDQHSTLADLGSDHFETHRTQARHEQLAEDLRILYVAVTRAKYRCYLYWSEVRTAKQANASALSYLLFGDRETDYAQQQEQLAGLSRQAPDALDWKLLPATTEPGALHRIFHRHQSLSLRERKREISSLWLMSSYTALSALSRHDSPELPVDIAQEDQPALTEAQSEDPIPRGAHIGNVLHTLLEDINFQTLAEKKDISNKRDGACQRFGLQLEQPQLLDNLLANVVTTPLSHDDGDFFLAGIDQSQCLKEMPFYLSLAEINTDQINAVLAKSHAFQPLGNKQMRGFLTGFIDLICLYKGRYYVMDYKSNALPDYRPETLLHAMREHNYGLQYWIYTLVLHRYLKNRLSGYDFERHFGGVRYLFMRGMKSGEAMSGVFQDRPGQAYVDQLDRLLGDRS